MLRRTPPASRFLLSQSWSASSPVTASFATSASLRHDDPPYKPTQPKPRVEQSRLPGAAGWGGTGSWDDVQTPELKERFRRPVSIPPRGSILPRQNANGNPPPAAMPLGQEKDLAHTGPHSRSEILKEMKAFIWEKITATEPGSDLPTVQYKVPRDPTAAPSSHTRKSRRLKLPPMDPGIERWIRSGQSMDPDPNAIYNGPTVLVLSGASKSLLESDFYRLAQQGKHLENWAVGLVRVVQARDPATYEPQGRYYIFFETRVAALAYEEEVTRLYHLARRQHLSSSMATATTNALSSSVSSTGPPGPLPLTPKLNMERDDDDEANVRNFTLVPPSAKLNLKLYLGRDLEWDRSKERDEMERNQKVLFRPDGRELHTVLVSLDGVTTTAEALEDAIERDAEERKVPWREVGRGYRPIRAVEPGGEPALEDEGGLPVESGLAEGEGQDVTKVQRFSRFIVPFTDENNVRRFVRHWHRREMPDFEGRDMTVTVNVTAMW